MSSKNVEVLSVGLRNTDKLSYSTLLGDYAKAQVQDPNCAEDLKKLDELRQKCLLVTAKEADVTNILNYLVQLDELESKFPINDCVIRVPFRWHSALGAKPFSFTGYRVDFEKASMIFNVASLYSIFTSFEDLQSSESVKRACNYFLQSAGYYQYLLSKLETGALREVPAPDFAPLSLKTLTLTMLAQGQDCFLRKGILDGMKPSAVSKLAKSAADLYAQSEKQATLSGSFTTATVCSLGCLSKLNLAIAYFYQSKELFDKQQFGAQIFRINQALGVVDALHKDKFYKSPLAGVSERLRKLESALKDDLSRALKDNNEIYHDTVPKDESALGPLAEGLLAKAREVSSVFEEVKKGTSKLLFANVLSTRTVQLRKMIAAEREFIAAELVRTAAASDAEMQRVVSPMNLNGLFSSLEKVSGLPEDIAKNHEVIAKSGGVRSLSSTLETLSEFEKTAANQLRQLQDAVPEYKRLDADFASLQKLLANQQFSSSMSINSDEISRVSLRCQCFIKSFSGKLEAARHNNIRLSNKLRDNTPALEVYGGSLRDVERSIPNSSIESDSVTKSGDFATLKNARERLDAMLLSRRQLIQTDLPQLCARNDFNTPPSVEDSIQDVARKVAQDELASLRAKVLKNVAEQAPVLKVLSDAFTKFNSQSIASKIESERKLALQNLYNAFDAFKEIQAIQVQATVFYTKVIEELSNFAAEMQDLHKARLLLLEELTNFHGQQSGAATLSATQTGESASVPFNNSLQSSSQTNSPNMAQFSLVDESIIYPNPNA